MSHVNSLLALMQFSTLGKHYRPRIVQPGREEIELVLDGRAIVEQNGNLTQLSPGDLVWHKSGEQTIFSDNASDNYECLILSFSVQRIIPPSHRIRKWQGVISARQFAEDSLNMLDKQGAERDFAEYLYQSCLVHSVALTRVENSLTFSSQQAYNLAYQAIAQNYKNPGLTLTAVAELSHMSLSLLHSVFKELTGMTPHQKILQFRMESAMSALRDNRPMKQVATMSGFATESGFTRAFKKYYGHAPTRFKPQAIKTSAAQNMASLN